MFFSVLPPPPIVFGLPMAFAVAAWFVSKMIRGLDGVAVLGGAVGVVWRGAWGWYGRADVAAVAVAAVGDCGVVVRC